MPARDMDLIRTLLLKIESAKIPSHSYIEADNFCAMAAISTDPSGDTDNYWYHMQLLSDAGMLMGKMEKGLLRGLSWQGCEFLDSIRDPEIWAKTKKSAGAAGGFTADLLKDLAKGFIRTKIEEHTGVKM